MFTSIHLFTFSCDTTSKVGTNRAAFPPAIDVGFGLLYSFGKEVIKEKLVCNTE